MPTQICADLAKQYLGHKDGIYALAVDEKLDFFISAGADGWVAKHSFAPDQASVLVAKLPSTIYALAYDREKKHLFVGQNNDGIQLLDLECNKQIGSIALGKHRIFAIKQLGDHILVGLSDGRLLVIAQKNLRISHQIKLGTQALRCIALCHTDQHMLAVGCSGGQIHLLSADNFEVKKSFLGHEKSVFSLQFNPYTNELVSCGLDAQLKIWSISGFEQTLVEVIVAHQFTINHVVFHTNKPYFATCSKDKTVKLWNAQTYQLLKVLEQSPQIGHRNSVNALAWHNEKDWLVSCGDDRQICLWHLYKEQW